MSTITWLTIGLAAFDAALLAAFYFVIRPRLPFSKQALVVMAAALSGFVFHAFMFFTGAFLILQLVTIVGLFGICMMPLRSTGRTKP